MIQQPSGVLNVDKPEGITSHDVVTAVRRHTKVKRVGHAGTLDPLATGVLLVCVGTATRISSYLQQGDKTYRTTIRLGLSTTTYDAQGEVVRSEEVPPLSRDDLITLLDGFKGEQEQIPPMYSAIKHRGQSLHKLARAGIQVARSPRPITIYDLEMEQWESPDVTIRLRCTPGTYVRSLAHDLGERLGCGGHVASLRRLASGNWRVEDAVDLNTFQTAGADWPRYLHGLRGALSMLEAVTMPNEMAYRFAQGQRIQLPSLPPGKEVRVLDGHEHLIGIGRVDHDTGELIPYKVLSDPQLLSRS